MSSSISLRPIEVGVVIGIVVGLAVDPRRNDIDDWLREETGLHRRNLSLGIFRPREAPRRLPALELELIHVPLGDAEIAEVWRPHQLHAPAGNEKGRVLPRLPLQLRLLDV